jgi:hypothetical protein
MKQQSQSQVVQTTTPPLQVWQTLTESQQRAVRQTVIHICHSLIKADEQEGKNEPINQQ